MPYKAINRKIVEAVRELARAEGISMQYTRDVMSGKVTPDQRNWQDEKSISDEIKMREEALERALEAFARQINPNLFERIEKEKKIEEGSIEKGVPYVARGAFRLIAIVAIVLFAVWLAG